MERLPLWAFYPVVVDPVADLLNTTGMLTRPVGTPFYLPPEVKYLPTGGRYEAGPADIWAFGVMWLQCR